MCSVRSRRIIGRSWRLAGRPYRPTGLRLRKSYRKCSSYLHCWCIYLSFLCILYAQAGVSAYELNVTRDCEYGLYIYIYLILLHMYLHEVVGSNTESCRQQDSAEYRSKEGKGSPLAKLPSVPLIIMYTMSAISESPTVQEATQSTLEAEEMSAHHGPKVKLKFKSRSCHCISAHSRKSLLLLKFCLIRYSVLGVEGY
jgi:hypothetical protein